MKCTDSLDLVSFSTKIEIYWGWHHTQCLQWLWPAATIQIQHGCSTRTLRKSTIETFSSQVTLLFDTPYIFLFRWFLGYREGYIRLAGDSSWFLWWSNKRYVTTEPEHLYFLKYFNFDTCSEPSLPVFWLMKDLSWCFSGKRWKSLWHIFPSSERANSVCYGSCKWRCLDFKM